MYSAAQKWYLQIKHFPPFLPGKMVLALSKPVLLLEDPLCISQQMQKDHSLVLKIHIVY